MGRAVGWMRCGVEGQDRGSALVYEPGIRVNHDLASRRHVLSGDRHTPHLVAVVEFGKGELVLVGSQRGPIQVVLCYASRLRRRRHGVATTGVTSHASGGGEFMPEATPARCGVSDRPMRVVRRLGKRVHGITSRGCAGPGFGALGGGRHHVQ